MKTDQMLSAVGETVEYGRQYIEQQKDYIRLEVAEKLAKTTSKLVTMAVVSFLAIMVLILLSVTIGFWLGSVWDSYALAFLCVTGFYALLAVVFYFFRREMVTNPVLSMIIGEMLD